MNSMRKDNRESLPLSVAERIDDVCGRFESAWKAGGRPRLEDYLGPDQAPKPRRCCANCSGSSCITAPARRDADPGGVSQSLPARFGIA